MSKTYHFKLFAENHQLLLEDAEADPNAAADPDLWDEETRRNGLATLPGIVSMGTARAGYVVLTVHLRDDEPNDDITTWDHVNECAITLHSGILVVRGCSESAEEAERIELTPGHYRMRIFYGNLDVEDPDDEEGDDYYKVALWPGDWAEPKVLKRYDG
jgi:hypothetical protein